jgi:CheY-like chemotaxis protein
MTSESTMHDGKHVLVVEDEPDFAALLRSILENAGYRVTTAFDGESAFEQLVRDKPDVITLDIHMPRKSGLFFYRKVKRNRGFRNIPAVIVTGLTQDNPEMETLIHTFLKREKLPHPEACLEKPVGERRLLETIENAFVSVALRSV